MLRSLLGVSRKVAKEQRRKEKIFVSLLLIFLCVKLSEFNEITKWETPSENLSIFKNIKGLFYKTNCACNFVNVSIASSHNPGCTFDDCTTVLRVAVSQRKREAISRCPIGPASDVPLQILL